MNVSDNIKAVRLFKGLTQAEAARRYDTSPEFYHRLEKKGNAITVEQLQRIAVALDSTVVDILTWSDEKKISVNEDLPLTLSADRLKDELISLQHDKISYYKTVIAKMIVDEAWESFESGDPDPISYVENKETMEFEMTYDEKSWELFLSNFLFGNHNAWTLYDAGLIDDNTIKEYRKRPEILSTFNVRAQQTERSKRKKLPF